MPKTDTSWGKVADWYEDAFSQKGSYQHELIYPNLLRMASPQKGERVFDVGCGGGSFSAELIAKGCVVFGADISPELILLAKKKVPKGIFFVSSAEDLSSVKEKDFDKAFIVLALQNIEKAGKAINEISRLLRPGWKAICGFKSSVFPYPRVFRVGMERLGPISANRSLFIGKQKRHYDAPGEQSRYKNIFFSQAATVFF